MLLLLRGVIQRWRLGYEGEMDLRLRPACSAVEIMLEGATDVWVGSVRLAMELLL